MTRSFPHEECFGLTRQMRRAAISVLSNIAEGHGRWTRRDCRSFLTIARGSAYELQSQLFVAGDLQYLGTEETDSIVCEIDQICRMMSALMRYYERAT